jgi:hypothetical protein
MGWWRQYGFIRRKTELRIKLHKIYVKLYRRKGPADKYNLGWDMSGETGRHTR